MIAEQHIKKKWSERLYEFFSRRYVYHTVMWLALFGFLVYLESMTSNFSFPTILVNELINIAFFGVIVYFNLYYLIPQYLTRKQIFRYFLLLILAVVIITPIKAMIFYLKFSGFPEAQSQIAESLHYSFIPPFLIAQASTVGKIIVDWARHLREKQELETRTIQSELNFLKSQINPHFLFNTLNNLYALTLKQSEQAPEVVIKLSEMMRYMLYECNEKTVPLRKEVHYLRNYLDLESIRQGKDVTIHFRTEGKIEDQPIAPLLFIPFLENSFKHGLNNQIEKGYVDILLRGSDTEVYFSIENSKPEKLPVQNPRRKSGGIGLVNVKRRLNILYPDQYQLNIYNEPKSYKVVLELEL